MAGIKICIDANLNCNSLWSYRMISAARYSFWSFLCLASVGLGQTPATPPTQTSPPPTASQPAVAKVEMPSDPAALLNFARERNGLDPIGGAPFHLKITYQALDENGSAKA